MVGKVLGILEDRPDPGRAVLRTGNNPCSVWRNGNAEDRTGVGPEHGDAIAVPGIPYAGRLVLRTGDDTVAVR